MVPLSQITFTGRWDLANKSFKNAAAATLLKCPFDNARHDTRCGCPSGESLKPAAGKLYPGGAPAGAMPGVRCVGPKSAAPAGRTTTHFRPGKAGSGPRVAFFLNARPNFVPPVRDEAFVPFARHPLRFLRRVAVAPQPTAEVAPIEVDRPGLTDQTHQASGRPQVGVEAALHRAAGQPAVDGLDLRPIQLRRTPRAGAGPERLRPAPAHRRQPAADRPRIDPEGLGDLGGRIAFVHATHGQASPPLQLGRISGCSHGADAYHAPSAARTLIKWLAIMGMEKPEVSQRYENMVDVAKEYLLTLEEAEKAPVEKLADFERRLAAGIAPYAGNPAFQAFLELKHVAKLGANATGVGEAKA